MSLLKWILGKQVDEYETRLTTCINEVNKLQEQIKELTEQKFLAQQDLESVKDLLELFTSDYLKYEARHRYYDVFNAPVLGELTRRIDSYLYKIEQRNNISWARNNGSTKQEVRFHGACTGCKSPTEIGVYRCLGCQFLMGVTSGYPDLSFK